MSAFGIVLLCCCVGFFGFIAGTLFTGFDVDDRSDARVDKEADRG